MPIVTSNPASNSAAAKRMSLDGSGGRMVAKGTWGKGYIESTMAFSVALGRMAAVALAKSG